MLLPAAWNSRCTRASRYGVFTTAIHMMVALDDATMAANVRFTFGTEAPRSSRVDNVPRVPRPSTSGGRALASHRHFFFSCRRPGTESEKQCRHGPATFDLGLQDLPGRLLGITETMIRCWAARAQLDRFDIVQLVGASRLTPTNSGTKRHAT